MSTQSRTVRLLQNVLYPTYQLYAAMGSKQTAPRDGLRLAALTTMEWLRQRIQDDIPAELCQPGPDEYRAADDSNLPSLHLNRGYVLDIVSLPEKGVWSLQITEPDLGSDPGKKEQRRAAVPGRVIETNVAFRIYGKELECGFQTVVSDPEGTSPQAEVYRLAVVRRLMENPAFGLTQILPVNGSVTEVKTAAQIRKLTTLISTPENQLPAVVFTYYQKQCTVLPVKNTAPKVLNTLPQQMPDIFSARQEMHYEERFNLLTAARQPEEDPSAPAALLRAVDRPVRPAGGVDGGAHQPAGPGPRDGVRLQRPALGLRPGVAGPVPGVLRGVPPADLGRPLLSAAGAGHDAHHRGPVEPEHAPDPAAVPPQLPAGVPLQPDRRVLHQCRHRGGRLLLLRVGGLALRHPPRPGPPPPGILSFPILKCI